MSSLTLYSLSETLSALLDSLDLCETSEQIAECEADIERTALALVHKVDDFSQFLAHLQSQQVLATQEIERLKSRRQYLLRTQDRLEQYAIRVMQQQGIRKLDGDTSRLSIRNNPPAVEITDEAQVPVAYKIVHTTVTCDKRAIKGAIDHGIEVPGATLHVGISLVRR